MSVAAIAIGGSAIVGAVSSNKASKRAAEASDRAAQMNYDASMAGFNLSEPYLSDLYASQQQAYNNMLAQGPYTGQTYAGMNPMADIGYTQLYDQGLAQNAAATGMLDTTGGFANNASNLYNIASTGDVSRDAMNFANRYGIDEALDFADARNSAQDALDFGKANNQFADSYDFARANTGIQDANAFAAGSTNVQDANAFAAGSTNVQDALDFAAKDDMQGALDYASGDRLDSLTRAAMRDPYRQLTENTLTGIDAAASGSGNMNSSRAGMADAIAQRAYDDRAADVSAGIQDSLMTQYLGNRDTLASSYLGDRDNQASAYRDDRASQADAFINNRRDIASDYRDAQSDASSMYTDSSQYLSDSYLTNQGDMRNFFGDTANTKFANMTTANNNLGNIYGNALASQGAGTQSMINAGNAFGSADQAYLNDLMANYDRQNTFGFDAAGQYSNMLQGLAVSNSPSMNIQPNLYDPSTAALTGGVSAGLGAWQALGSPNLFGGNQPAATPAYTPAPNYGVPQYGVPTASGNLGSLNNGTFTP